jgi:hypothetical protein
MTHHPGLWLNQLGKFTHDNSHILENGEWGMGNGEWGMGDGEWGNGELPMTNYQ